MIRCPKCGKEHPDGFVFCTGCLASLSTQPTQRAPTSAQGVACASCGAENDPDATYCDQCGLAVAQAPEAGDCPDCGGPVKDLGDGKGVCSRCGAQLKSRPEPAAPQASVPLSRILSQSILEKLRSGMALELAVERGCQECLGEAPGSSPVSEEGLAPCPVCGAGNPAEAGACRECGISFKPAGGAITCPRCAKPCSDDICPCGAILTLSKLVGFLEPSVRQVCPRCKQLLTTDVAECPTCACNPIPAERLKAYAARG